MNCIVVQIQDLRQNPMRLDHESNLLSKMCHDINELGVIKYATVVCNAHVVEPSRPNPVSLRVVEIMLATNNNISVILMIIKI